MAYGNKPEEYSLEVNVAPTVEPVTWAEMQSHSRIDETTEQTYVETLIQAARIFCENHERRSYINQTLIMRSRKWPDGNIIVLPRGPLSSVTSVQYIDVDGVTQTWSSSLYVVDTSSLEGRIEPISTESFPDLDDQFNAVTITYVAGYGATAASVPARTKHAIKMLAAHWYENRTAVEVGTITTEIEFAVESLLSSPVAL